MRKKIAAGLTSLVLCIAMTGQTLVYAEPLQESSNISSENEENTDDKTASENDEGSNAEAASEDEGILNDSADGESVSQTDAADLEGESIDISQRTLDVKIKLDETASSYKVSLEGIPASSQVNSVRYAVWSDKDWQDDLKWYTGSYNKGAGTSYVEYSKSDFNTAGLYYVDVYGVAASGTEVYLGGITYTIDVASAKSVEAEIDNPAGWFKVTITDLKTSFDIKSVRVAAWSEKGGQDDLYWYTAGKQSNGTYVVNKNLVQHDFQTGKYNFHVYVYDNDGNSYCVGTCTTVFTASSDGVTIEKTSNGYKASLNNIIVPGGLKSVRYAIWSADGGQDDLKWYTGTYNSGSRSSSLSYSSSDFSSYGLYYVDVYAVNAIGRNIYIGGTTYSVDMAAADGIVVDIDNLAGWFKVTVNGLSSAFNIQSVEVEVWSEKGGQDDLFVYTAQKQSNGSYIVNKNLYNHSFDTGVYNFYVYVRDVNGNRQRVGTARSEFTASAGDVSISKTSSGYKVSLSNIVVPGGIKSVRYAVWSDEGWQDDLKWYTGTYNSGDKSSSLSYNSKDFNTIGLYYVDIYGTNVMGKSVYLGGIKYTTAIPTATGISVSGNKSTGAFSAAINGLSSDLGVSEIRIAVWSDEGWQDDLKWYTASRQSNGTYSVSGNISEHGFSMGKYYFDAYVKGLDGKEHYLTGATADLQAENLVSTTKLSDSYIKISIYNPTCNGKSADTVRFATWSDANGQDDIIWESGTKNSDGSFSVNIYRSDFADNGAYTTHIYTYSGNSSQLVGNAVTYSLYFPTDYDAYSASVMRNIIYAVETGGQIYGNARYNDFTPAYTNSKTERAITIGAGCWYGLEAKRLLTLIRQADPEGFAALDTAGIGDDLDKENWVTYGSDGTVLTSSQTISDGHSHRTILPGSDKALVIQKIISTDIGIAIQNQLVDEQMAQYVQEAAELGVTDLKARMFCANIRHLGGFGGMRRVVNNCISDGLSLTMENLWATMLKHDDQSSGGNQVGSPIYQTRHKKVMQWLNTYIG